MTHDMFAFGPSPAERRRTARLMMVLVVSTLLLITAIAVPLALQANRDRALMTSDANLNAVKVYDNVRPGHTDDDVNYPQSPPVGGLHNPKWLACGAYDHPVPEENVVHDLEHGTVWITYRPGLAPLQVNVLVALLPDDGIISPYDNLSAPVVVTVWARQLELRSVDDPRLQLFLAKYGDGHTAPEPLRSCGGGLQTNDFELKV
jgi:hypothetical protein